MTINNDFSRWITDKYIYVMLLIYPLFWGFWGYTHITASKFAFFAAATVIWLALLTVNRVKNGPSRRFGPSAAQLFLLGFFLTCCVSAAASEYFVSTLVGEGRFDGLATIILCLSAFAGVSAFARPKRGYVSALAVSMTLCCLIAVTQLFGLNALGLFPNSYNYYDGGYEFSGEFLGTIGNADLFAAYLCLCLPLFCACHITAKKPSYRLLPVVFLGVFCVFSCSVSAGKLALGLIFLIAAPLLITDASRLRRGLETAAVILLALCAAECFCVSSGYGTVSVSFRFSKLCAVLLSGAALAFAMRFLIGRRTTIGAKPLKICLTALSALAAAAGLLTAYNWKGSEGSIYELSRVMHGEIKDSFGSSRILIWRSTLALVKEKLLLGGGPGTLSLRLGVHFSRYVEETGKTLTGDVDNAHNVYLGILANTGLISLVFYLAAIVSSLVSALRRHRFEAMCVACALICYWIQDFFGLGLFIVSPIMFILWGLMDSASKDIM